MVQAVDKKKARLNCIHHLLSADALRRRSSAPPIVLPARVRNADYRRQPGAARDVRAGGVLKPGALRRMRAIGLKF